MASCSLRPILVVTILLGLCLLAAPGALAQELNFYIGNSNSSGPWSLRSSSHWGASFEYPIWWDFSVEQRVGYLMNFPETAAVNTRTSSVLSDTNVNYNLPFRFFGLVPYVTMGFGFMHAVRNDPNNLGTNLDFNYGGGVKFLIPASPLGVRLDMRGHHFRHVVGDEAIDTIDYTVGVLYRLGRN